MFLSAINSFLHLPFLVSFLNFADRQKFRDVKKSPNYGMQTLFGVWVFTAACGFAKKDAVSAEKTDLMTHVQTCLSAYHKLLIKKRE